LPLNALTEFGDRVVIGHRGNAAHAPENTLESFAQAIALGVDALEFDVRLTRDGVPVVLHDATLARTTDRADAIAEISYPELRRVDAGAWFTPDVGATFPYRGRGLTIPALADVLTTFPRVPVLIEVKVDGAGEAIYDVLAKAGALKRTVAASMQGAAVASFRQRGVATGGAAADVLRLLPRAMLGIRPTALPYEALCIPLWYGGLPIPVTALARSARAAGVTTHVWTIDAPETARRLWSAGVQGIITNDPATMIRVRAELGNPVD
jgi:glycerophosphoryl diester phosphodiesterase